MTSEDRPRSFWHWLKERDFEQHYYLSEIVAKIGLLAAGLFAVYQFSESQRDKRVERVITYVDRFEQGDIAEARQVIRERTRPYFEQFATINNTGITPSDRAEIVLLLIEDDADGTFANSLERVADFFDGMRLCYNTGLCDRETVDAYFCPRRSTGLWTDFKAFYLQRRSNNPAFGDALEWCAGGLRAQAPK